MGVIVVATADFALYHEAVSELRGRGVAFTTVEPGEPLPQRTRVVITAPDDVFAGDARTGERAADAEVDDAGAADAGAADAAQGDAERVVATAAEARRAVDEALSILRGGEGRTVVGVDPGVRPGIVVMTGETVVAAFHVPLADAVGVIREEVADAPDAIVRIGDGARLQGAQLVNALDDVRVELVDETGTTPYLGQGANGMGDVLAAVNIARLEGEPIDSREIEPTAGELQRIKNESRERSGGDRTIDEALARRVAAGELTLDEALSEHRNEE